MSGCNSSNCSIYAKGPADTSIVYTGPSIPSLGICTSSSLYEVDEVILQTLVNFSTGVGIHITNVDLTTGACAALFADCISCCGTCTDLPCLLNCYHTAICTEYTMIQDLTTLVEGLSGPFDTACLARVTSSSSTASIIQEIIYELCKAESDIEDLQTAITDITNNINVNIGNYLLSHLVTCSGTGNLVKTGTGNTASIQFRGFVPIGAIIPYAGPLSDFSSGVGLSNTQMCGWNIANGLNGTVNMMGQVPVGVTNGIGGTLPANASGLVVAAYGDKGGEAKHTLIAAEIPSVPFTGTTPGVSGSAYVGDQIGFKTNTSGNNGISYPYGLYGGPAYPHNAVNIPFTVPSGTFNGSTGGGNGSHNNMQPYTGVIYIQRMF